MRQSLTARQTGNMDSQNEQLFLRILLHFVQCIRNSNKCRHWQSYNSNIYISQFPIEITFPISNKVTVTESSRHWLCHKFSEKRNAYLKISKYQYFFYKFRKCKQKFYMRYPRLGEWNIKSSVAIISSYNKCFFRHSSG